MQGPENRDELQLELDNIISVRFIQIFGANTKNIEGHTKKRHLHVPCKKRHLHAQRKVSSIYDPEAKCEGHLLNYEIDTDSRGKMKHIKPISLKGINTYSLKENVKL